MVKKPVCLVQRSVKTDRNIEVRNFWIHAAKVNFYFGFRKFDFRFFCLLISYAPALLLIRAQPVSRTVNQILIPKQITITVLFNISYSP
jgi:hypothetical protein